MRHVEVLLPPAKMDDVIDALVDIGVDGITLGEAKSVHPANRRSEVYLGSEYVVDFALKVKMDLVVQDDAVPRILEALRRSLGIAEAEEAPVLLSWVVDTIRGFEHCDEAVDRLGSWLDSAKP